MTNVMGCVGSRIRYSTLGKVEILSDVIEVLVDKGDVNMQDMALDLQEVLYAVTDDFKVNKEGWDL